MSEREPTCIGVVRHVLGSTVTVELNDDLAGVAPIYRGRLQPVGQVGSLVRIPQGLVDLVAIVNLVGISEIVGSVEPIDAIQNDSRWLQVQLLGEIDRGTQTFKRGVGSFPSLDDEVHFATPQELATVYPRPNDRHLKAGWLASAEEVPVCLDASKLVVRHSAIVGSTGSGKTSAVSSLLQGFVNGGWHGANIVVIDPHGEYSHAMEERAAVRSVLGKDDERLRVPFWALPAMDILRLFAGKEGGATFNSRFQELVTESRRNFAATAVWLNIEPNAITCDTPIPFDIRSVWLQLEYQNRETREIKADPATACCISQGNAATLTPPEFRPYNPGGQAPFKGADHGSYGTMPDLLRLGLSDPRLAFFQEPEATADGPDPLITAFQEWLGNQRAVSVLDFSGVPSSATDLAIGVVTNLIFEVALRCNKDGPGIGRPCPVLVVLEEAHRYLGEDAHPFAREAANRIAREGRKYGVGLMLVSQRPTELPKTALAQCGTIIALRLSNSDDQGAVKSALPDSIAGLASVLPSLRTHEAVISGEAVILPSRTRIDTPSPWPHAEDPDLQPWRQEKALPDVARALSSWRGTLIEEDSDA